MPSTVQNYMFAALVLLQFLITCDSSGLRLFISAPTATSKVIYNNTYSNTSWSIVGQCMFQLREISQMEHEMCQYLDWGLNIER